MAFDAQITDLVGGTIDQTACDQWMEDGVRELVNLFPKNLKEMCYSKNTFTSAAAGSEAETIASQHLGNVFAGSYVCRRINGTDKYKASDSDEMLYATSTDPAYYIEGGILNILPASSSGVYYLIPDPSIDASADSAISSFPNEAEYLVVLYASIKQLHQYMNSKKSDLPSDIVTPVLETISESLPTWSAPSDFVTPVKPVVPILSAQTLSAGGVFGASTAPTYSKPTLTTRVALSSYTSGLSETDPGIFQVTAPTPIVPTLTTITFSSTDSDIDASLPTYTTATISAGGVYGANTPPSFSKPSVAPDFAQVNTYIDTNEDIELASAKLQEISSQLNEYQANIQNEQIEFNKENIIYQANIQEAMQELQVANQVNIATAQGGLQLAISNEDRSQQRVFQNALNDMKVIFDNNSQSIQKYQSELSTYQANINKEVQQYGQRLQHYNTELNVAYQAWAKTESDSLAQYSTDIQNELNEFNKENTEYQAKLQKDIQDAGLSDANEARKLQKYQAEVGTYGSELNTNVQTFTQALTKNKAAFDTSLQKYSSEIQKVVSSNGSILQKYQGEVGNFSAKLQKQTTDYQWYQGQHAQLKADYQQGLQQLIGGGVPAQQQQGR